MSDIRKTDVVVGIDGSETSTTTSVFLMSLIAALPDHLTHVGRRCRRYRHGEPERGRRTAPDTVPSLLSLHTLQRAAGVHSESNGWRRGLIYRVDMQYLMLMWADADATGGDESDFQAWATFDEEVRAAGAFVFNGALQPAATQARLVRTAIAGHHLQDAVEQRPFAEGERQIQAFYIMECRDLDSALEWANKLPTYGYVEVRELIQF